MASLPYIQLYVADYLADTMHLTTTEHGAYMLLIMNYWQRGKALPNDDHKLASIVKMTPEEWQTIKPTILEFFEIVDDTLVHYRIESDLQKVNEKSVKASNAGKASARKRFNKRSTDVEQTLSECSTDGERPFIYKDTDKETDTDTETDKDKYIGTPEFDLFAKIRNILNLLDLPFTETRFCTLQRLRTHNQIRDSGCLKAAEHYKQDEFYISQGYDWLFNHVKSIDRVTEWAAKKKPLKKDRARNGDGNEFPVDANF